MNSNELRLLSGGAAQSVVSALMPTFLARTGVEIAATFQAVGALRDKLRAGEPCDVFIATKAMLADLAVERLVAADTIALLGSVHAAIAVRAGDPVPAIADREELRASLAAATAIYLPDPERATAGMHFVHVLRALQLHDELLPRLRSHPSGTVAMAALAESSEGGCLGCTQATEINARPGVSLVGPLPGEFDLETTYAVGVCEGSREPALARQFVRMVAGRDSLALRRAAGFEP